MQTQITKANKRNTCKKCKHKKVNLNSSLLHFRMITENNIKYECAYLCSEDTKIPYTEFTALAHLEVGQV
jgi:hypothetical protein